MGRRQHKSSPSEHHPLQFSYSIILEQQEKPTLSQFLPPRPPRSSFDEAPLDITETKGRVKPELWFLRPYAKCIPCTHPHSLSVSQKFPARFGFSLHLLRRTFVHTRAHCARNKQPPLVSVQERLQPAAWRACTLMAKSTVMFNTKTMRLTIRLARTLPPYQNGSPPEQSRL